MKLAALLCILFSPLLTFAFLNESWKGTAYWYYQGQGPLCDTQMKFKEDQNNFTLQSGYLDCGVIYMSTPNRSFTKESNGELSQDGKVVGAWQNTDEVAAYKWQEQYNATTTIHINMTVRNNVMTYQEQWLQSDGSLLYDINGYLKPLR